MGERSVLITGCSSGIGLASAREMKSRGWRVFATARKPGDLARLNVEGFESLYLDYAEPDSIASAAEHVLRATDEKLGALFNNGGYGQPGAVEDLKPAGVAPIVAPSPTPLTPRGFNLVGISV